MQPKQLQHSELRAWILGLTFYIEFGNSTIAYTIYVKHGYSNVKCHICILDHPVVLPSKLNIMQ